MYNESGQTIRLEALNPEVAANTTVLVSSKYGVDLQLCMHGDPYHSSLQLDGHFFHLEPHYGTKAKLLGHR